jgi:predicted nucleotidyltransferase
MRLTPAQSNTIHNTASQVLGEGALVWLYGSRLDDKRRGGDVDLLVESPRRATLMDRARLKWQVEQALQLPVDLLICAPGQAPSAFEAIARAHAVCISPSGAS